MRVAVIPGDGVVVREADTLVVIAGGSSVQPDLIDRVVEMIQDKTGEDRVRRLARLVLEADDPPAMAVLTLGEAAASVFLYGNIGLTSPDLDAHGADHVLGVNETVSLEKVVRIVHGPEAEVQPPRWNHLESGAVRGAGVAIDPSTERAQVDPDERRETPHVADREDVTERLDVAEPAPAGPDWPAPFEAVSLTEGADMSMRSPLPIAQEPTDGAQDGPPDEPVGSRPPAYEETVQVLGVYSPRDFFNHPDAKYCSRTGVKMGASQTAVLTEGPRPPLGVLTLDDGATLTVRWNTVIGRDPSVHELVEREEAAPFVVSDAAQSVSRTHALIELVEWDVLISDLNSRNGTHVQLSPDEPLRQLASGERIMLRSGTIVQLGDRSFVFHEHHVR